MYELTLFLHSWIRWAFWLLLLITLYRSVVYLRKPATWSATDTGLLRWITITADIQLLLGILLYALLSPTVAQAFSDPALAMRTPQLRFWFIEHPLMMLITVILSHLLRRRVSATDREIRKRRLTLFLTAVILLLSLISTPLPGAPWSPVSRPLFHPLPLE